MHGRQQQWSSDGYRSPPLPSPRVQLGPGRQGAGPILTWQLAATTRARRRETIVLVSRRGVAVESVIQISLITRGNAFMMLCYRNALVDFTAPKSADMME